MNKFTEFPITIYGEVENYNDILSKARCRIFYKYANRNGTFISDEFAQKLLSTLPYVPIKGIYDGEDFTDHGLTRDEGRIYGIVPENPNLSWERHTDADGVEREYACADVLIFTALYKEANDIVGKSLSMEIYEPSIKYHKAIVNGQRCIVFDDGCFLGLQALGDEVEPCFEGASFYALQNMIEDTIHKIKEFSKGGQSEMHKLNFKLSDSEKHDALWQLLNPEYNEEGQWTCSYSISEIFEDYALAFNYETRQFERIYYTKDDEQNLVEITGRETVYIVDITEQEKTTLDTLRKLNGDTYELVSEDLLNAQKNVSELQESNAKIEELNESISTLNTEVEKKQGELDAAAESLEGANNALTEAQTTIHSLNEELEAYKEYKTNIETGQKESIIAEYADKLSKEVLETFQAKLEEYTPLELDKELAYELKKSSNFAQSSDYLLPKEQNLGGIEEILSKYKK